MSLQKRVRLGSAKFDIHSGMNSVVQQPSQHAVYEIMLLKKARGRQEELRLVEFLTSDFLRFQDTAPDQVPHSNFEKRKYCMT